MWALFKFALLELLISNLIRIIASPGYLVNSSFLKVPKQGSFLHLPRTGIEFTVSCRQRHSTLRGLGVHWEFEVRLKAGLSMCKWGCYWILICVCFCYPEHKHEASGIEEEKQPQASG